MADEAKSEGAAPAPKKKRGLLKIVIAVLVVLIVVGGAAGGFLFWKSQAAAVNASSGEAKPADEHAEPEGGGVLSFDPFVVNLADEASRFLRVNLRLVVKKGSDPAHIQEDEVQMLRARSAILEFLTQQRADELVTAEGKDKVKKEIAERANKVLGHGEVIDVLFSEFVVQF